MKTKQQRFEELISILKLAYTIDQPDPNTAVVQTPGSSKSITLKFADGMVSVLTGEEEFQVLALDEEESVGVRVLDIENILTQYEGDGRRPIALSIYLYYTLLGMIWGLKADPSIRDQDPTPGEYGYILLHAKKQDKTVNFEYTLHITGAIRLFNRLENKEFLLYPIDYVKDPEKQMLAFFEQFKDVDCIYAAGRQ